MPICHADHQRPATPAERLDLHVHPRARAPGCPWLRESVARPLEPTGDSPGPVDEPSGRTWQTDCFQAPGALIRCFDLYGRDQTPRPSELYTGWPFENYRMNQAPE